MAADLLDYRRMFAKSVVVRRDLSAGTELRPDLLVLKKPGTGIPSSAIGSVIGRTLRRAVAADSLLSEDDLV